MTSREENMYAVRVFSVYAAICSSIMWWNVYIGIMVAFSLLTPLFYWVTKDLDRALEERYKHRVNVRCNAIMKRLRGIQQEYGLRNVEKIN